MVAVKGKGWILAPSLDALVKQMDRTYPGRDHTSDGSIGDQAHASRESDHNPSGGFVHAVDIDEDIAPGLDLKGFAEALRTTRDPRLRYAIYEGRILKAYASNGLPAWSWHRYTGPNSHSHHLHVSINRTAEARNDLRPWPLAPQEDDMSPEQMLELKQHIDARVNTAAESTVVTLSKRIAAIPGAGPVDEAAIAAEVVELIAAKLGG